MSGNLPGCSRSIPGHPGRCPCFYKYVGDLRGACGPLRRPHPPCAVIAPMNPRGARPLLQDQCFSGSRGEDGADAPNGPRERWQHQENVGLESSSRFLRFARRASVFLPKPVHFCFEKVLRFDFGRGRNFVGRNPAEVSKKLGAFSGRSVFSTPLDDSGRFRNQHNPDFDWAPFYSRNASVLGIFSQVGDAGAPKTAGTMIISGGIVVVRTAEFVYAFCVLFRGGSDFP